MVPRLNMAVHYHQFLVMSVQAFLNPGDTVTGSPELSHAASEALRFLLEFLPRTCVLIHIRVQ